MLTLMDLKTVLMNVPLPLELQLKTVLVVLIPTAMGIQILHLIGVL